MAPMAVLPNFVPTPTPPPAVTRSVSERPFFLCVGRLEKLKGVRDLIKVFRNYNAADLVVVGDGGYTSTLKQEARSLPHIKFTGSLHPSKLGDYYRQALAVLVPSLCYEVFSLVSAEALSYGTPVIVRRIGALTEIIEESGGGFTFVTLDDCRAAMERLQTNPILRNELGALGQNAALDKWTTDVHLGRYFELIAELRERREMAPTS